jgi:hypothetical protein
MLISHDHVLDAMPGLLVFQGVTGSSAALTHPHPCGDHRWLASPSSPGAEGLLQQLHARGREGAAGDAAAACWAAAGLAAAGALGEAQTGEVVAELRRLARGGRGAAAPSAVVQAAAAAAARVLPAVHPADWRTREAVVAALRAVLVSGAAAGGSAGDGDEEPGTLRSADGGSGGGGGGGVRSAAAEALAFAACHALRLGRHDNGDQGGAHTAAPVGRLPHPACCCL